jgi:hypothetical protein
MYVPYIYKLLYRLCTLNLHITYLSLKPGSPERSPENSTRSFKVINIHTRNFITKQPQPVSAVVRRTFKNEDIQKLLNSPVSLTFEIDNWDNN